VPDRTDRRHAWLAGIVIAVWVAANDILVSRPEWPDTLLDAARRAV